MMRLAMRSVALWQVCAFAAFSGALAAQSTPELPTPILQRIEATDPLSGNHYVRLLLSLPPNTTTNQTPPRFTVQCEDIEGKHEMLWFVSFGGVADPGYEPPFHATANNLYPPHYPGVSLKMTFEGYIKLKPVTRSWSVMPTGELRYRNSGSDSPNMESARWYLRFLSPLPGLRIVHAKPESGDPGDILFPTKPLLEELNKTPICSS